MVFLPENKIHFDSIALSGLEVEKTDDQIIKNALGVRQGSKRSQWKQTKLRIEAHLKVLISQIKNNYSLPFSFQIIHSF